MLLSNESFVELIKAEKSTKLSFSRQGKPVECLIHCLDSDKETLNISFSLDLSRFTQIPIALIETIELLGSTSVTLGTCEAARINFIPTENPEHAALVDLIHQLYEALATNHSKTEDSSAEFLKWPPWGPGRGGWNPPWDWSRCAKCQLEVNVFIVGTVFVATAGAGPSALAVAQSLFLAKYGAAAWEAVKDILFSATVDVVAKAVCRAIHNC